LSFDNSIPPEAEDTTYCKRWYDYRETVIAYIDVIIKFVVLNMNTKNPSGVISSRTCELYFHPIWRNAVQWSLDLCYSGKYFKIDNPCPVVPSKRRKEMKTVIYLKIDFKNIR